MAQVHLAVSEKAMLSVRGIYKSFSINQVLKGIDLDVFPGDVLALIGGNGAGKSTLVKIIMGIHLHDRGEIYLSGEKAVLNKPSDALEKGIYLVPQEPMLFPNMTVEENILIGFSEKRTQLRTRLSGILTKLGWKLDIQRKADSLSIAEQQLVEILRGLMRNAKVLIFDEPTSALTFHEVKSLFELIETLKAKKIGIIYITHRLTEVFEIANHVAIMRDGIITLNGKVEDFTHDMLVKGLLPPNAEEKAGTVNTTNLNYAEIKPVLEVKNFTGFGFKDINLEVYPGEILGLAGVVGAGRTELATTIFGKDRFKSGEVLLAGENVTGLQTSKIMEKGINYVTEDRYLNGIFRISDVAANTSASSFRHMGRFFLNNKLEKKLTDKYITEFRIKVTGRDQIMGSLSGGNQQKIVIARALSTLPKVVILDEPTRGIDAAARQDVYKIINMLKMQGVAILLISSDLEEVVELSDRAVTMFRGRVNQTFSKADINQDNLMAASFGVYRRGENNGQV